MKKRKAFSLASLQGTSKIAEGLFPLRKEELGRSLDKLGLGPKVVGNHVIELIWQNRKGHVTSAFLRVTRFR